MSSLGTNNGFLGNENFFNHICRFIGQTVTIFTTSGGASGCGFTGVVLSINRDFVRLATHEGTPPSNPLSESICGDKHGRGCNEGMNDYSDKHGRGCNGGMNDDYNEGIDARFGGTDNWNHGRNKVGSVCDIPLDRIVAFCHNAV